MIPSRRPPPFPEKTPHVRIVNGADVVFWNADKSYLFELETAGFPISKTTFVDRRRHSTSSLRELLQSLDHKRVVIKPSVSASCHLTHLVKNPKSLCLDDEAFLEKILNEDGYLGSIIVQEYEEAITKGEYSLVYIGGELTFAMIKKLASGEFRVNGIWGPILRCTRSRRS